MASNTVNPNWESNYKSLKNYYSNNYDPKYFGFTKYELEIDPSETVEQIEEYSFEKQKEEIIKCAFSFNYFCHKYIKITHPRKGLLPFILFKYPKLAEWSLSAENRRSASELLRQKEAIDAFRVVIALTFRLLIHSG